MLMLIVDFFNVACVKMLSRFCGSVDGVSEDMVVVDGLLWMKVDLDGCCDVDGCCDGSFGGGLEMDARIVCLLCGVQVSDFGVCDGVGMCCSMCDMSFCCVVLATE